MRLPVSQKQYKRGIKSIETKTVVETINDGLGKKKHTPPPDISGDEVQLSRGSRIRHWLN